MTSRLLIATGLVNLMLMTSALALNEHIRVTPGDDHVSVAAKKTDKGHVRFTISRDPSKNPGKTRHGWLSVSGETGFVAECAVESVAREGQLTFSFELADSSLRHSKFTLNEIVLDKDGHPQVGGATILEVRLADFAPAARPGTGQTSASE